MANRQSLSLFRGQAPTVSRAEASPTPVSPWPCMMSPHPWNGGFPVRFFWGCCWAFFLLQAEQGTGSGRPMSRGRRGQAVSPSVFCRPRPCGRRRWGLRNGLGLLSSQDSGRLRGRLNLLGNETMLMVTSCFHLCRAGPVHQILSELTPVYKHSSSGNRGWAECFPGNSSLTSGKDSDRVSDDATNVRFG